MALMTFKPTSPGRRTMVRVVTPGLHKGAPHAALVEKQGNSGGRNNAQGTNTAGGRRIAGPRQYCWSHGACAHSSSECNSPHDGHQSTATFQNMQGGSTNNLQWVPATNNS